MTLPKYKILVTGAGGFIGFHVSMRLLHDGHEVVGLDNMNDYYDVGLKRSRQAILLKQPHFRFVEQSLEKKSGLDELFRQERFDVVVNLAAQAGVRYSLTNPYAYLDSNLAGFLTILEACRNFPVSTSCPLLLAHIPPARLIRPWLDSCPDSSPSHR